MNVLQDRCYQLQIMNVLQDISGKHTGLESLRSLQLSS